MPFQIIRNDITKVKADAIVNTANPRPCVGAGTDSAVYAAAGEKKLLAQRKLIGDIAPGDAAYTDAFKLDARYIIHTVGPEWVDGKHAERETLRSCYERSLSLAEELKCESVAFPLIATGSYGFPKDEALSIALSETGKFLLSHEMKVILVVFDRKALELSERLVGDIDKYIDEHGAEKLRRREYGSEKTYNKRRSISARTARDAAFMGTEAEEAVFAEADCIMAAPLEASVPGAFPEVGGKSLEELLAGAGETFQQRLFRLIDASGLDDVTVYKRANIDRKVFSRIRCKEDYRPRKTTAVAFAVALRLDMPSTLDLLSRAEIAFSPSSTFDLIVTYFITNGIYDIFEINAALFKYGQPTLGC